MTGHIHDSAIFGLTVFAWVLILGFAWHMAEIHLIASDGDKKQAAGKAMALFY